MKFDMSYCRWSSDFFECDVYVYANVSGMWTTHVAGRRLKHRVPDELKAAHPHGSDPEFAHKYMAAYRAVEAWRNSLPCDELPVNYAQPDGTSKPGIWRTPKASEYLDLREIGAEAGESYDDASPGECADRLEQLKAKGFNVPQYAIDALREDQLEIHQIQGEHAAEVTTQ
jgi:hypothetical protein